MLGEVLGEVLGGVLGGVLSEVLGEEFSMAVPTSVQTDPMFITSTLLLLQYSISCPLSHPTPSVISSSPSTVLWLSAQTAFPVDAQTYGLRFHLRY